MQEDIFEIVYESRAHHVVVWSDRPTGLQAICVIDDVRRGPAVGGVRTQPYPSFQDALGDAAKLAKAMTAKCTLVGLPAGGGKIVVMEHSGLDRSGAFSVLGERVRDLGGLFWAGSDLGTRRDDLLMMAKHSRFVHTDDKGACLGVARGVLASVKAAAIVRGLPSAKGLRVAIQGCGAVGHAVASLLAENDIVVVVADVDDARAHQVASAIGGTVIAPEDLFHADVDVISPCAVGGVLTAARVENMKAWAVVGGANNILSQPSVADLMMKRNILYVPDVISSAGGVAEGIVIDMMGEKDPSPTIERLGALAHDVLTEAARRNVNTLVVTEERVKRILDETRR